jgi:hypothetical protein
VDGSAISAAGLSADRFSTHSFRREGPTFVLQAGAQVQAIKMMGDWASNSVCKYIYVPESTRLQVTSRVTQAISSDFRHLHCAVLPGQAQDLNPG